MVAVFFCGSDGSGGGGGGGGGSGGGGGGMEGGCASTVNTYQSTVLVQGVQATVEC